MRYVLVVVTLLFTTPLSWARYNATLIKEYSGKHSDAFALQYDRVRLLTRQAQVEVSSRLGLLQYREGFQFPMLVRFEDDAPAGIEHALAYVRLSAGPKGFIQELVVNLSVAGSYKEDFDLIFYHEMTHAVLNDAVGGEAASRLPPWVQEGLAQYVSEEGKARVARAASQVRKSQASALLYPLNGAYTARGYPQYYLAIEAMHELHSINSVQAFVRNLANGKSVTEALTESTGLTWDQFEAQVQQYSLKVFTDKARPDFE